ncbi:MAG: M23 family metallopeptidase [Planctomycetes bacterium]|nr:M23 family metallopeptidase [Planctomycetota bacterium]
MHRTNLGLALALALVLGPASAALAHAHFVWPQTGRVTSNFKSSRPYGYHRAIDIAGPNRTAITAARGGRVASVRWDPRGYGLYAVVGHAAGYQTLYAHLSSAGVRPGASVGVGATLGLEGSTGNSTGPHVHFEVRRWGAKQYVPASVGSTLHRGQAVPRHYSGL